MNGERVAIRISPSAALLISTAADLFVDVATEAVALRGQAAIALAGGSTPRALFQLLATPDYVGRINWGKVQIWFGDERCVGPDDPESNYGMAHETLLRHVPIPANNIHRIQGELAPALAAQRYESELHGAFQADPGTLPRFDLIWLGLGPDGHTASLFPATDALKVQDHLVVANHVPQMNTDRITFTLPLLNAATIVAFLVSGEDKAPIVARVIEEDRSDITNLLPAQRIDPFEGQVLWLLDLAAAGELHM